MLKKSLLEFLFETIIKVVKKLIIDSEIKTMRMFFQSDVGTSYSSPTSFKERFRFRATRCQITCFSRVYTIS